MTGRKRHLQGIVVSDRMEKTIVVQVSRLVRHPNYPRVIRRAKKFKVHDPLSQAHVGDEVRIEETRPISKEKCWRLAEILRRGVAHLEAKEEERKEELKAVGAIREKQRPAPVPSPAADTPLP
jgi:small subunit ribosomal protein S17